MQAYAAAKARVFGAAGAMVLNRDDEWVATMRPAPVTAKTAKGSTKGAPRPAPHTVITFGSGLPAQPGDYGLETVHGMTWLVRAHDAEGPRGADDALHLQRLMPADALRIQGRHNALNALAALALAHAAGCPLAPMLYGLREYRGEPHRVQSIGCFAGVEYFDDSKGTNVGATVAALQGLGAGRKLVVILNLDDSSVKKYSLLNAPEDWLKDHPYFKYSADKIIYYRISTNDEKKIWKLLKLKPEYEQRMKLYIIPN